MYPLFLTPTPLTSSSRRNVIRSSLRSISRTLPSPAASSRQSASTPTMSTRPGPAKLTPLALLALPLSFLHPARTPAAPFSPPAIVATSIAPAKTTALATATPAVATRGMAPAPSLADRVSFYLAEYLMWNPGAKVLSLLAFTLVTMWLGQFLYRMADPDGAEAPSPLWHSVRAIANPLEDDWNKNSLRTTSIALAAIGMVVFAILVGMVTESVETAVANADGELSRVVVSDHILVCGWSPHVSQILKDVNKVSSKTTVVVLASPEEKETMFDEIRSVLSEEQRRNLRIFYRPGAPIIEDDLARVAASRAKKIILVNSKRGDPVDADRLILSRALALRQNLPSFSGDIVAELSSPRDETILRSIFNDTKARSVETVNAERQLFRFMAQAIRQPGLADVVAQLMGNDPSTVFHVLPVKDVAPSLVGTNIADFRPTSIPGSILCGFFDETGAVHINNGHTCATVGPTITADTNLLLLGTLRKTTMPQPKVTTVSRNAAAMIRAYNITNTRETRSEPESFLVCGWRHDMIDMLRELDSVVANGSKITIMDLDAPDAVALGLKNLTVSTIQERADRYENLEALLHPKAKHYDNVVLLGSAIGDDEETRSRMGREEDTKTLASLVYVNELLAKQRAAMEGKKGAQKTTTVTVEFLNERVATMAKEQNNIANAILPQNLGAKIAAQTVRDSRLNAVWSELLSQEGREVYIRPSLSYSDVAGTRSSFTSIADRLAKENDDIVIGYVAKDGKVVINPQGEDRFNGRDWDALDMLIVLSEN